MSSKSGDRVTSSEWFFYQSALVQASARVNTFKNIAVVGAGWAGLAAAVRLQDLGARVTVFEAAPITGGRARGVDDIHMGCIDNGQHLMLGAYTETLRLIERLHPHVPLEQLMLRTPLHLESADGAFKLHAPSSLPAPLNTLWALFFSRGISVRDSVRALSMMTGCRLKSWRAQPSETVAELLERYQQSAVLLRRLWVPLCLASLNTPIHQACAQLFLNVLRDSLDARQGDSDLLIPRVDLTRLWPAAAAERVEMRYRHIVRALCVKQTHIEIDTEPFDACVLATPPYAALRILLNEQKAANQMHAPIQEHVEDLHKKLLGFEYRAIATLTLELEADWRLPAPMMMLDEDPKIGHFGQWAFNRAEQPRQLTVVVSDAADYLKLERAHFVQAIAEQIRAQSLKHPQCTHRMPEVRHHRLIVEKRATFDATPALPRPSNRSPWTRVTLAGDWTDTGYPSVLEGAVRSGQAAANLLLA